MRVISLLVLPALFVAGLTIWAADHERKQPIKRVGMVGLFKVQGMKVTGAKVWKVSTKRYRHKRTTHKIEREL